MKRTEEENEGKLIWKMFLKRWRKFEGQLFCLQSPYLSDKHNLTVYLKFASAGARFQLAPISWLRTHQQYRETSSQKSTSPSPFLDRTVKLRIKLELLPCKCARKAELSQSVIMRRLGNSSQLIFFLRSDTMLPSFSHFYVSYLSVFRADKKVGCRW